MLLSDFLIRSAEKFPQKTALKKGSRKINYRQLNNKVNSLANYFIRTGVKRGERIAVYLENSIESVISVFAILKAGAVFVVINPQVKSKKLFYILNDCTIKRIISDLTTYTQIHNHEELSAPGLEETVITNYEESDSSHIFASILSDKESTHRTTTLNSLCETYPDSEPPSVSIDIDLASLSYTSGSTGEPKGVMLTHLNMVTAVISITTYLQNREDDIILNYLPLSFDYGLYQVLMSVSFGGTLFLEKAFIYPYQTLRLIEKERITGFPIVPAMAALLSQHNDPSSFDFSSLRYITNTGQALSPAHIRELKNLFPSTQIYSMYGLTECKRVSYLPPEELGRRPHSVGKAIPNSEVWLIDKSGKKIENPGITGQLVIRGAHVMKGYWNKEQESERVLKKGLYPDERVLLSGDFFKMDRDGYLYFVSRIDEVIKSGGERISPKEVEDVIYEMAGISEVAVIGVPDTILGCAVKAFVVFDKEIHCSEQDIIKFCMEKLERSRVPKYVEKRESLPKSNNGKIKKSDLIAEAGRQQPTP